MNKIISAPHINKSFLQVLDPTISKRLGRLRSVLFDFDGTLSVLRQGWEDVMAPMMLSWISPDQPPSAEMEAEVRRYVDRSTGTLTIQQMEWLAETVERYGMAGPAQSAAEYKRLYLERLGLIVKQRTERLERHECVPDDMMISGAREFLDRLAGYGLLLYLASGSDHPDVLVEARILGLESYFGSRDLYTGKEHSSVRIYGALDESETHDKARVIGRILDENNLHGDELLVVGDGPVEIREGNRHGAITLGVASDEISRHGWNERKVRRLTDAGASMMIGDFHHSQALVEYLLQSG